MLTARKQKVVASLNDKLEHKLEDEIKAKDVLLEGNYRPGFRMMRAKGRCSVDAVIKMNPTYRSDFDTQYQPPAYYQRSTHAPALPPTAS